MLADDGTSSSDNSEADDGSTYTSSFSVDPAANGTSCDGNANVDGTSFSFEVTHSRRHDVDANADCASSVDPAGDGTSNGDIADADGTSSEDVRS